MAITQEDTVHKLELIDGKLYIFIDETIYVDGVEHSSKRVGSLVEYDTSVTELDALTFQAAVKQKHDTDKAALAAKGKPGQGV